MQDRARSFAAAASDDEKYSLYMAATGFDAVLEGLAKSQAKLSAWQEDIEKARTDLLVYARLCDTLERLYDILHCLDPSAYPLHALTRNNVNIYRSL